MKAMLACVATALVALALILASAWWIEPRSDAEATRVWQLWQDLPGSDRPHPCGSAAHAQLRAALEARFASMGLETAHQSLDFMGSRGVRAQVHNLVARRLGSENWPPLVIMAHYDSVGSGPGAADDGAGMAVLLELAQQAASASSAPQRTQIFLATDAEEQGLVGAEAFAHAHPWAREPALLINLEARGTSGPAFLFETIGREDALIRAAERSMSFPAAFSLAREIYERMPNDTDLSVFRERGWDGYNLAFVRGLRHYHTPLDSAEHLDRASLSHLLQSASELRQYWTSHALPAQVESGSAHTSLFGRWLVHWPERANGWIAAVLLVCLVLWGTHAWRAGLCALGVLLSAAALGAGAQVWMGSDAVPTTQPGWIYAALGLLVYAAVWLGQTTAQLWKQDSAALALGTAWCWALFTLWSAILLPGAFPNFALVLLAGLLGEALRRIFARKSTAWCVLPMLLLSCACWSPLLWGLAWILDYQSCAALAVLMALCLLPLLASARAPWPIAACCLVAGFGLATWNRSLPAWTPKHPLSSALYLHSDLAEQSSQAQWVSADASRRKSTFIPFRGASAPQLQVLDRNAQWLDFTVRCEPDVLALKLEAPEGMRLEALGATTAATLGTRTVRSVGFQDQPQSWRLHHAGKAGSLRLTCEKPLPAGEPLLSERLPHEVPRGLRGDTWLVHSVLSW